MTTACTLGKSCSLLIGEDNMETIRRFKALPQDLKIRITAVLAAVWIAACLTMYGVICLTSEARYNPNTHQIVVQAGPMKWWFEDQNTNGSVVREMITHGGTL